MSGPSLNLNKSEIVRAGAGAGKTTNLTKRVMDVAETFRAQHNRMPRVVVTTFTRKATEELRERLLKIATEKSGENSDLVQFVSGGQSLCISTIHGVLTRFLRRYGHLLGLDANFSVVDRRVAKRRELKILKDLLVKNKDYQELLRHFSVRALNQALADSLDAVVYHQDPQPAPLKALLERRNAKKAEVSKTFADLVQTIAAENINEKWNTPLATYTELILYFSKASEHLAEQEALAAIADVEVPNFIKKNPPFSEELNAELKVMREALAEFSSDELTLKNIEEFARLTELFAKLRQEFLTELDQNLLLSGQLEMRDLERLAMGAMKTAPEVAQAFGAEWDYWLIDEFQDTSPLQVELLKHFIGKKPAYFVGDPQQSIYLFRGARKEVFAEKEKEIVDGGGELSYLIKNYRSQPGLLLFFNDVFAGFGSEFMKMEPKSEPVGTPVVATIYDVDKDSCRTLKDRYAPLVAHIRRALNSGARPDDYCVLARRNSELLELARELEAEKIPTHVHSGGRYYERREIIDILSFLKFLLNPYDNLNVVRVLRSPWFYVSDTELVGVTSKRPANYWQEFSSVLVAHPAIVALSTYRNMLNVCGVFETLRSMVTQRGLIDYAHLHDSIGVKEANIWKLLSTLREGERTPGFQFLKFVNEAIDSDERASGEEESDAVAALEPNRVNLMTIHKAKGLKFKNVILPNLHKRPRLSEQRGHETGFVMDEQTGHYTIALKLVQNETGDRKSSHSILARTVLEEFSRREIEELDRLFYVAMTRAVDSVVLHWLSPPEKESWAERLKPMFAADRLQRDHYAVEVLDSCDPGSPLKTLAPEKLDVRSFFIDPKRVNQVVVAQKSWSVTELVEEKSVKKLAVEVAAKAPTAKELQRQLELPVWGQKLHTFFERVKYTPDIDAQSYFEKWFGADAPRFLRAAEFTLGLSEPPLRQLIESGNVEWGFQLKTARGLVEGQIDLWGTDSSGITWLVDYKSGSPALQDKAFRQLDLYTLALRAYGVTGEIRCVVIYALNDKVVVKKARDSEAIKAEFGLSRAKSLSRQLSSIESEEAPLPL